jgi:hypothetical protein
VRSKCVSETYENQVLSQTNSAVTKSLRMTSEWQLETKRDSVQGIPNPSSNYNHYQQTFDMVNISACEDFVPSYVPKNSTLIAILSFQDWIWRRTILATMAGNNVLRTMVSVSKFAWKTLKKTRHMLVVVKTWAADLYLIYKLEPKARVCVSDKDRKRITCLKNDHLMSSLAK